MITVDDAFKARVQEFLSRAELSSDRRLYGWLSASVALASEKSIQFFISLALINFIPVLHIKEVILQNYLFCGFPNAIEGLIILRRMLKEKDLNFVSLPAPHRKLLNKILYSE